MVATYVTTQYNHTARKFLSQTVNLNTLKVMLLDPTATFNAANTTLAQVAGVGNTKQVANGGWATGGQTFLNVSVVTTTTDDAQLIGDDIRVRATGGNIGPASAFVVYDDSDANDAPLFYVQFSEAIYAGEGTDFLIKGLILTLMYTAP